MTAKHWLAKLQYDILALFIKCSNPNSCASNNTKSIKIWRCLVESTQILMHMSGLLSLYLEINILLIQLLLYFCYGIVHSFFRLCYVVWAFMLPKNYDINLTHDLRDISNPYVTWLIISLRCNFTTSFSLSLDYMSSFWQRRRLDSECDILRQIVFVCGVVTVNALSNITTTDTSLLHIKIYFKSVECNSLISL